MLTRQGEGFDAYYHYHGECGTRLCDNRQGELLYSYWHQHEPTNSTYAATRLLGNVIAHRSYVRAQAAGPGWWKALIRAAVSWNEDTHKDAYFTDSINHLLYKNDQAVHYLSILDQLHEKLSWNRLAYCYSNCIYEKKFKIASQHVYIYRTALQLSFFQNIFFPAVSIH